MTRDDLMDPLTDALARLPELTPRRAHEARVRARCHALLVERRASPAPRRVQPLDFLIAASTALYVVAAVTKAVALLRNWSG